MLGPLKEDEAAGTLLPQVIIAGHGHFRAQGFNDEREAMNSLDILMKKSLWRVQEIAMLAQISMDCERLLARCFESYYALSETAAAGILEGGQATTDIPAPALKPAIHLCSASRHMPEKWVLAAMNCAILTCDGCRHPEGSARAPGPDLAVRAIQHGSH